MKWIEDVLKAKLGNSKADANPTLDESLWNKVQTGLSEPTADSGAVLEKSTGLNRIVLGSVVILLIMGVGVGLFVDSSVELDSNLANSGNKVQSDPSVQTEESFGEFNRFEEAALGNKMGEAHNLSSVSVTNEPSSMGQALHPEGSIQSAQKASPWSNTEAPEERVDPEHLQSQVSSFRTDGLIAGRSARQEGNAEVSIEAEKLRESWTEKSTPPPLKYMEPQSPGRNWPIKAVMHVTGSAAQKRLRARSIAVRAFGGVTLSDFQYTSDELKIFSDHFHAGSSAMGGIAVDFNFKNQQWSVGLGWSNYAQRLEFEETWSTEYVEPDALVSLELNPITGDTLSVQTGPVLVSAAHHRHFRNYNRINSFIIPIEWRKEFLISRWTFGVGLGGKFHVRSGVRGHSFASDGTLAAYNNANSPYARIAWSPSTRLYAGYQFLPEWRLDASVILGFQSMGMVAREKWSASELTEWDGRLRTMQITLGITRFLNVYRSNVSSRNR